MFCAIAGSYAGGDCLRRPDPLIGQPDLAHHYLRRTFTKLSRKGGAALEQIQINLGHESLETTQKYLGEELDYQHAPGDSLGLNIDVK